MKNHNNQSVETLRATSHRYTETSSKPKNIVSGVSETTAKYFFIPSEMAETSKMPENILSEVLETFAKPFFAISETAETSKMSKNKSLTI
jgi:hypothetical protein